MPVTDTPLRYPGGKSQLTPLVVEIMQENDLFYGEYAEPFAGGAGIAITLLVNGYVDRIHLNDFDPAIYALWQSILTRSDELCELIERADVSIEEWHRQRAVYFDEQATDALEKGFATLFLNRTNRSGIIKAGVIGGLSQEGNYKLDCRFQKAELIRKIQRIADYSEQIFLTRLDAARFVRDVTPRLGKRSLINLDPPYFRQGPELYTNFYQAKDHATLARAVSTMKKRWMVTYDDAPEIRTLYAEYPMYSSKLNYYAQVKRMGTELLVLDPQLSPPQSVLGNEVCQELLSA